MGQSYRIQTELGINKTINVQLDQEFEFLEILSLKIQQSDIYTRSCADYGVLVGRITANNGFGLPNARVSIFIPIETIDESNPIIQSIYPYKSPSDKNDDGYRYNLLPYEKSYSKHAATGTLPSRNDVLTGTTAVEIYDKYYKFTAKTNESGDYMIMGVPLGEQTLVMDVDLSDIGEFSLTPQDLIRMGLATEGQVAGNQFRTSTDLNSLPQIINLSINTEISPLWGDPDLCQIAINRVDFDLRDSANIDIQPTAVFMGSMFSTPDSYRVRKNAKPRDDMGNLCNLEAGPGQILAVRQTIQLDSDGNPILEQYQLEQSGNVIDGGGTWLVELPMNLDYLVTNQFGEKVISNDPTIGIPTKGKYRFKIKWTQPPNISEQTRRPNYLVPNIKEYGWNNTTISADPNYLSTSSPEGKKMAGSYYFGLDWSGYTNTQAAINCEDTFYPFQFNRVYTVAGMIDEFKNGAKGRFVGIKEIDSSDCSSSVNKFPVNDGFRNFDLLYFVFAIIMQVIQIIGIPLLTVYHFIAFLWNNFAVPILIYFIIQFGVNSFLEFVLASAAAAGSTAFSFGLLLLIAPFVLKGLLWAAIVLFLIINFNKIIKYKFGRFKLPMITYPDCQACDCNGESTSPGGDSVSDSVPSPGLLSQLSNSNFYVENLTALEEKTTTTPITDENYDTNNQISAVIKSQAIAGFSSSVKNPKIFKAPESGVQTYPANFKQFASSSTLPAGERINVYNTRNKYFQGVNKIKVTFASNANTTFHYDNTLTVLSSQDLQPGDLVSFVSPALTTDSNYLWTGQTAVGGAVINGINGIQTTNEFRATVNYALTQTTDTSVQYTIPSTTPSCVDSITINVTTPGSLIYSDCTGNINVLELTIGVTTITNNNCISLDNLGGTAEYVINSYGNSCQRYVYPSDIEYYQVLTAITITKTIVNGQPQYSLPNLGTGVGFWSTLNANNTLTVFQEQSDGGWLPIAPNLQTYSTSDYGNFSDQKVLILQRGVDPYSPLLTNRYGIGKILGYTNEDDVTFTASTRMNIPIQKLPVGSTTTVQQHNNQNNIFYPSYFYTPSIPGSTTSGNMFIPYKTSNIGYYGALDSNQSHINANNTTYNSSDYVNLDPPPPSNIYPKGVVTKTNNRFYSDQTADNKYDIAEDLSGGAIIVGGRYNVVSFCSRRFIVCLDSYNAFEGHPPVFYYSPILYPTLTGTSSLDITISNRNVMRTDRLPSSDYIDDGGSLVGSVSLLQQNLGFAVYSIRGGGITANGASFSTGASQVTPDIEGQLASENVLVSMNTCENMVGLTCYSGNSVNFGIKTGCEASDAIESGCYIMMNKPLIDLINDLKTFEEWGYRFRFFYGLCRGVLAQSFVNNWVNGTLYLFPVQVDTKYGTNNKPLPPEFAKELVYFDDKTNNFYYRSSPYLSGTTSQYFIGRPTNGLISPTNTRNLLFPTTIINLGIKDSFYQEIIFDPSAKGYVMKSLNTTSYSDTSDLVNLFVISRIANANFLSEIVSAGNNGLNKLFSRPEKRIDGDLAQSMSINSEYGVIPFSPEFYNVVGASTDPVVILGNLNNPTMGIFFSSTTVDLQNKDFLTPGVIDFRPSNNANAITYPYGINSQFVPFYQWELKQGASIFGSELNNWKTDYSSNSSTSGIFGYNYQSLDRRTIQPNNKYFIGSSTQISDIYERGYIFNVDANGDYSSTAGNYPSNFLVSAPFHFYFGLIKGDSALDKFKTKYSILE